MKRLPKIDYSLPTLITFDFDLVSVSEVHNVVTDFASDGYVIVLSVHIHNVHHFILALWILPLVTAVRMRMTCVKGTS